jgi:branched-chain amino acid transport system permease protein
MSTGKNSLITIATIFVVLAVLPAVLGTESSFMNVLVLLFIYITLSQSWNLLGGYSGQINLGLAAFFGTGLVVTHFIWIMGIPVYIAALGGSLSAVILASVIALPTLRLKGMYFSIGTLALAEVLRIIISNVFTSAFSMPGSYATTYDIVPRYYFGLAVAIIATAVVYFVTGSKLGLALVSVRDDEEVASVMGINTYKYKFIAVLISSFLAGLAGGVYAFLRLYILYISRAFGPLWTFEPLMATVIGGTGTLLGPILGSAFLVILSEVFALTLGEAHLIIFGILFILVVLYFPGGFVGSADRIVAASKKFDRALFRRARL